MNMISRSISALLRRILIAAVCLVISLPLAHAKGAQFDVMEATIDQIHASFKSGRLTSHQLVQLYLDRIAAYDKQGPNLNCIITINPKALEDADKLDAHFKKSGFVGPLHGIPILVKDEIDTAGMPTTLGSLVFKDFRPTRDAFVVERLRAAGAIILGKTTLGEMAAGDTFGSYFGVSRNPYDLERTPGGSSGGSGAALAANFSAVALGEETVGSARRPGAWNSVVAMRPTSGLVSRSGMYDGWPSRISIVAPMARNVGDLARLLDSMVGYDPEDPQTALGVGIPPATYTKFLAKDGLKGARIGILRESIGFRAEPGTEDFNKVTAAFDKNVAELRAAGAIVIDPIVIPRLRELRMKGATNPAVAEQALEIWLNRNPNSPYKSRADIRKNPDAAKIVPPGKALQWTNPQGPTNLSSLGPTELIKYYEYVEARDELMMIFMKVLADNKLDAIVHKSVEHQPTLIEDGIGPPYVAQKGVPTLNTFLVYTSAITVPSGFTEDKLPVGITFFGRPYAEPTLLKLAYAYEQATRHRVPPKTTPALAPKAAAAK